jgi:hypothetical protein
MSYWRDNVVLKNKKQKTKKISEKLIEFPKAKRKNNVQHIQQRNAKTKKQKTRNKKTKKTKKQKFGQRVKRSKQCICFFKWSIKQITR